MNEIKKILNQLFLLAIEIFVFAYTTIKQIILPGKRKKGNLLSILFIFFVGIIERLGSFKYGMFQAGNILKHKYVKQSLLIIAGILFLLSSFEWTTEKIFRNNSGNYTVQISDSDARHVTNYSHHVTKDYSKTTGSFRIHPFSNHKDILNCNFRISSSIKTFILIRSIRI